MFGNLMIGVMIFAYAGWVLFRFVKKSRAGQCSSCDQQQDCSKASNYCSLNKN